MERQEFKSYRNSFLDASLEIRKRTDICMPLSSVLNKLSSISALYQYSNPPPMGYGTPGPKVAESVLRAYGMNKNDEDKKFVEIDGFQISHTPWVSEGPFPWGEPSSNFDPSFVHESSRIFLKENFRHIKETVEDTVTVMMGMNSDVLTKGKQTWCPITEASVPCATAYEKMITFMVKNGSPPNMSVVQLISEYFKIMKKRRVTMQEVFYTLEESKTRTKKGVKTVFKKKKHARQVVRKGDSVRKHMLGWARSFCTYIKHGERAHLERRAIASPNIIMRALLLIIETVHLKLGRLIEGSTISIGGEEKKEKIVRTVEGLIVGSDCPIRKQSTEDATKWNETLSAALFGMVHKTFFDPTVRKELRLERVSTYENLYSELCMAAHYILAIKRVTLGPGLKGITNEFHGEIPYSEEGIPMINSRNKEWFKRVVQLREGNNYILASPGMLMGMHNAYSTTVGLVGVNVLHSTSNHMKVLRSSDDSMTMHAGKNELEILESLDLEYKELKLFAIALSLKKTMIFREKYGEFTSWFQDDLLVSQFGPETTTLRPGGKNPHDDFYLCAKSTSISLLNCSSNVFGAELKLTLGINNVRSLYRISRDSGEKRYSSHVRVLADGGSNMWDTANCHLEETSLKEAFCPEDQKVYFKIIRNPENPFSTEMEEDSYYDKDTGAILTEVLDNPRTIFSYVRRSNRASSNVDRRVQEQAEKDAQEALRIITNLNFSTSIRTPTEATSCSSFCVPGLAILREGLVLTEDEERQYLRAMRALGCQTEGSEEALGARVIDLDEDMLKEDG